MSVHAISRPKVVTHTNSCTIIEGWSCSLTSCRYRDEEVVTFYLHATVRLNGVVLKQGKFSVCVPVPTEITHVLLFTQRDQRFYS